MAIDNSSSNCVQRMYCGLSPEYREHGFLMILRAFADGSERGDIYTVAGYVAPIKTWDSFSSEWYKVLKESPRLGYYRTSDALSLNGQFRGWTAHQRDARVLKLAKVVSDHKVMGVAAHLYKSDFEEFFRSNFLPVYGDPYYLCALYLISSTAEFLRANDFAPTKLDFIFDREGKVGDTFQHVFRWLGAPMLRIRFPFLGDVKHENKTEFLPLQAADMHAGWVRRNLDTIQLWTCADSFLQTIDQHTFPVTKIFLKSVEKYRQEHASELDSFAKKVTDFWEKARHDLKNQRKRDRSLKNGAHKKH